MYVLGVVLAPQDRRKGTMMEVWPSLPRESLTLAEFIRILTDHMGPAGRVLQAIADKPSISSRMLIATSDVPTDVESGWMHHSTNFRELGTWTNLCRDPGSPSLKCLPPSDAKASLLRAKALEESTQVFLIYVYDAVCGSKIPPTVL